jgi:hypothetical protein
MRELTPNENNGFEAQAESFSQRSETKLEALILIHMGGHAPCPF